MPKSQDESWRDAREGWERLTWARRSSKFETAKDAALSLGMNEHTYRAYERAPGSSKSTPLDHQTAIRFGRKFGVNWLWLLTGEGTPHGEPVQETPLDRAVTKAKGAPQAQQDMIADLIERILKAG